MVETDIPRLSTVTEISSALGLPRWRLYELAANDLIPHVRVGRSVRFNRAAVAAWVRNGGTAGLAGG